MADPTLEAAAPPAERAPGHYWVRVKYSPDRLLDWEPARWSEGQQWWVIGVNEPLADANLGEIGEPVVGQVTRILFDGAPEPSVEARLRADQVVAKWLAHHGRVYLHQEPGIGIYRLILAVAAALDDLALPLASLLEGIRNGEPGALPELTGERWQAQVNTASAALWRHHGEQPRRMP